MMPWFFVSRRAEKRAFEIVADELIERVALPNRTRLENLQAAEFYAYSCAPSGVSDVLRMRVERALKRRGYRRPKGVYIFGNKRIPPESWK